MTNETKHLYTVIGQLQIAFPWMIESITHKADELLDGNYSDELKHAIAAGELLETVDVPEELK